MPGMPTRKHTRKRGTACIFVHAGAGYHSEHNELIHLSACNDAAASAMAGLKNGGCATDAVEMAIKVLEDREITNAGYGSNLAIHGAVECDAVMVDHAGRSGACGAVPNIKNPICLAKTILDRSHEQLSLRRVPPNLLVGTGAVEFAADSGIPVVPHDLLISPAASERWRRWKDDLRKSEGKPSSQSSSASPPPAWLDAAGYTNSSHVSDRLRREHAAAIESSVWNEAQPISPTPPNGIHDISTPESNMDSGDSPSVNTRSSVSTSLEEPDQADFGIGACQKPAPIFSPNTHRPSFPADMSRSIDVSADFGNFGRPANSHRTDLEMSSVDDDDSKDGASESGRREAALEILGPARKKRSWTDGSSESGSTATSMRLPSLTPSPPPGLAPSATISSELRTQEPASVNTSMPFRLDDPLPKDDHITDTVGAIAIDEWGYIACGASSGGIGMKHKGRIGPAAIVGVGAAVVPVNAEDHDKSCVAVVTSGTGEHMATTMAATMFAERIYSGVKKVRGGRLVTCEDDDEIVRSVVEREFMGHPSVTTSKSNGAIGVLCVKKTRAGISLQFAHNTDSFAIASQSSNEPRPACTMSRLRGSGKIANGGRYIRTKQRGS